MLLRIQRFEIIIKKIKIIFIDKINKTKINLICSFFQVKITLVVTLCAYVYVVVNSRFPFWRTFFK